MWTLSISNVLTNSHLAFDLGSSIERRLMKLQLVHVDATNHERLVSVVFLVKMITVGLLILGWPRTEPALDGRDGKSEPVIFICES